MQTVDTEVDGSTLTGFDDLVVELLLHLGDHFLDTCRMDTSVADELMERQTTYLTAHRVEAADDDGLRCIVDDNLHAGSSLKGSDVTALTTDDTALHLVIINMEHADRVLNGRLSGYTLDGLDDNLTGLLVGVELSLVHDLIDIAGSGSLGLVLQRLDETSLGIGSAETRHLFEHLTLLLLHFLQFLGLDSKQALLIVYALLLVVELVLLATQLFLALVEGEFTLLQLVLALLHQLVALLHLFLQLTLLVKEFLLHLEQFLLFDDFSLFLGRVDHLLVFPLQHETENQISANSTQYECAGGDQ